MYGACEQQRRTPSFFFPLTRGLGKKSSGKLIIVSLGIVELVGGDGKTNGEGGKGKSYAKRLNSS